MKKISIIMLSIILILISLVIIIIMSKKSYVSFQNKGEGTSISIIESEDGPTSVFMAGKIGGADYMTYTQITMEEAQRVFENNESNEYIILDVRHADEFAKGHIPNAINIPNETIAMSDIKELQNKEQIIYVYCRSGNRSKQAAEKLASLGYTNIIECGGIIDWTGNLEY